MKAISLYSGAGGLDMGFRRAGYDILWANDNDKDACMTYRKNIGEHIWCGEINDFTIDLMQFKDKLDLVIGGPPCQGFSVAGKMDPNDPRSLHVWKFAEIVDNLQPRVFVMENVKALGKLKKWEPLRFALLSAFKKSGYAVNYIVLNSSDFDVPQSRERVFFIGFKTNPVLITDLEKMLHPFKKKARTVREVLSVLNRAGTGNNIGLCRAKITLTPNPVLRKSPYAGMLFNGLGRPVKLDGYCATLPASMGGNKTPIIDEEELYENKPGWVLQYHEDIMKGKDPLPFQIAPKRLRRLTVEEAAIIQTFPIDFDFCGSQSSKFRQIGNAVPCNLAYAIAKMLTNYIEYDQVNNILTKLPLQLEFEGFNV